ncbi:hypothetical protein ABIC94_000965 [Variovorax paradoxus]|uniref:hypothetical protein n=1 Tax=Variovorax paradoxus TaxID=34073 RepID=UPI0033924FF8
MTVPLAASFIDLLFGLELGPADESIRNRCSLESLVWKKSEQEGLLELGMREFEATGLRLASDALVLEIGRIAAHEVVGQVRTEGGVPRLSAIEAVEAELSGVKLHGPLVMPPQIQAALQALQPSGGAAPSAGVISPQAAADAWCFGPLAEAEGAIRGQITDAHLLFDADVTVPIRQGLIDFNDATVEHVGPDSRMGVSRLGLYVDAPNGRSYLYQFASAPLAGVEFEHRGALLSPWVSERGKLHLKAFAEAMLRQSVGVGGQSQGLTEQARLLLGRTALAGEVQLSDGLFAVPGAQAHVEGSGEGRNAVGVRSDALHQGLTLQMASLSARDAVVQWRGAQLGCEKIAARVKFQVFVEGAHLRFVLDVENCKVAGLRLDLHRPENG